MRMQLKYTHNTNISDITRDLHYCLYVNKMQVTCQLCYEKII